MAWPPPQRRVDCLQPSALTSRATGPLPVQRPAQLSFPSVTTERVHGDSLRCPDNTHLYEALTRARALGAVRMCKANGHGEPGVSVRTSWGAAC